jgi:hypothetical protein
MKEFVVDFICKLDVNLLGENFQQIHELESELFLQIEGYS